MVHPYSPPSIMVHPYSPPSIIERPGLGYPGCMTRYAPFTPRAGGQILNNMCYFLLLPISPTPSFLSFILSLPSPSLSFPSLPLPFIFPSLPLPLPPLSVVQLDALCSSMPYSTSTRGLTCMGSCSPLNTLATRCWLATYSSWFWGLCHSMHLYDL